MFGCEAAVKHSLLESENPKYLGMDDGMINIGLMTKLYHVVAHNLNEARKARDNKEARWLYVELKSHISFFARSHENSLMRLYKKDHLAVAT